MIKIISTIQIEKSIQVLKSCKILHSRSIVSIFLKDVDMSQYVNITGD